MTNLAEKSVNWGGYDAVVDLSDKVGARGLDKTSDPASACSSWPL